VEAPATRARTKAGPSSSSIMAKISPAAARRNQDDKTSRLAALAAWNAAADAERLWQSNGSLMRRRISAKQRPLMTPALGRSRSPASGKNAPRGHYDVLQLPRSASQE
ncbi:unnamed protein product, partial [Symbiodinium pilosum]